MRWAALAGLASLGIVWSLQEQIVQLIYDERLPRFINSLFKNRDRHDVERYVADTRALLSSVFPYLAALMAVALFATTRAKDASQFLQRLFRFSQRREEMQPNSFWAWLWGIFAIALAIRFLRMPNLSPYIDEYLHLVTAIQIVNGDAYSYSRAEMVTQVAALMYRLVEPSGVREFILAARFPAAVFSALAVWPVALIARMSSPLAGLLAALFWALSPSLVAHGTIVREYAYFPTILAALMFIGIYGLAAAERRRPIAFVALGGSVAAAIAYAVFDSMSTFRAHTVVLAATLALVAAIMGQSLFGVDGKVPLRRGLALLGIAMASVSIAGAVFLDRLDFAVSRLFGPILPLTLSWDGRFFGHLASGIGSGFSSLSLPVLALGLVIAPSLRRGDVWGRRLLLGAVLVTILTVTGQSVLWSRFPAQRHLLHLYPMIAVGIGIALAAVWNLQVFDGLRKSRKRVVAAAVLAAAIMVSWTNIVRVAMDDSHATTFLAAAPFSGLRHFDIYPMLDELKKSGRSEFAMVGPFHLVAAAQIEGLALSEVHFYNYRDIGRHARMSDFVSSSAAGSIVIDPFVIERGRSLPRSDFSITREDETSVCITYRGVLAGIHRWDWSHAICEGYADLWVLMGVSSDEFYQCRDGPASGCAIRTSGVT